MEDRKLPIKVFRFNGCVQLPLHVYRQSWGSRNLAFGFVCEISHGLGWDEYENWKKTGLLQNENLTAVPAGSDDQDAKLSFLAKG